MSNEKKLYITIILLIISALGFWFVILDFSRFFSQNYSYDIYPSALLKRISVILAAIICWDVGNYRLSLIDSKRMKAVFIFVILGETAFIIGERILGVGMFSVCQTLLILRNTSGISSKLKNASHKQKKDLIISGLIVMLIIIVFPFMYASLIRISIALIAGCLYGIILSISLWAGLACNILELLPKRNSRMIAVGMICFYCCDVLVGLDTAMETGISWLFVNSFIWIFYIPALVLLSLSCYRYERYSSIDKRTHVLHNITKK